MDKKASEPERIFAEYESGRDFKAGLGKHGIYTVSYTHLDVYKRQRWRCVGCAISGEMAAGST